MEPSRCGLLTRHLSKYWFLVRSACLCATRTGPFSASYRQDYNVSDRMLSAATLRHFFHTLARKPGSCIGYSRESLRSPSLRRMLRWVSAASPCPTPRPVGGLWPWPCGFALHQFHPASGVPGIWSGALSTPAPTSFHRVDFDMARFRPSDLPDRQLVRTTTFIARRVALSKKVRSRRELQPGTGEIITFRRCASY